jgi:phenylalanyl-tRNA synthetase beta chain
MKISANWIRDFVSPAVDDREMADLLTASGIGIEGFYNDGADLCYEAEVTTNRVDAMNHYGVAREVSAIYDLDLKTVAPKLPAKQFAAEFPIEIEDAKGCARYTARIVRGVKTAPSPKLIAHRLELIDQRAINNVADATNYALNELGHPTHAFDLDLIEGGKIVVRRARAGETLTTLDGIERKLTPDDLVIADAVKPVALAGIMGGEASMITPGTKNVLIESAWFDPATIRRTARRLGMHTDASHRFERGADYGITSLACARVAELIMETAGGELSTEIDAMARKVEMPTIALHRSEVVRILGADIPEAEIARIMARLGFTVAPGKGGAEWSIIVPTWRLDVEREIDLIEEIARIYGYLKLPSTLPSFAGAVIELPDAKKQSRMRELLLALGYNESLSSTFISLEDAKQFGCGEPLRLANPLSDEAAYMRSSLVPNLLSQVAYNLNRGTTSARLFEIGHVFQAAGEKVEERGRISFAATGNAATSGVHGKPEAFTFFHLKGDMEKLLGSFDGNGLYFDRHVPEYYHPGRSARAVIGGATVARFGQIHPDIAAARKLKQDVFIAEILPERLYQHELREPDYKPVPKFPAVERDFSFLFPEGTEFEQLRAAVVALGIAEMKAFEPAEIFRGGNLPTGKYSLLVRARFQSSERTLRDEEIAAWSQQIIKALEGLGGTMRA